MKAPTPLHVVPMNDTHEHEDSPLCSCMPLAHDEGMVYVHNSFDRREVGTVIGMAMDMLGLALANHDHIWSDKDRKLFEHARHLLTTNWPKDG